MHPAAAQSLLAYRPSRVVPFFALSIVLHLLAVGMVLTASWLLAPKLVDLNQKPIRATLVRLGKPRDEKLLPRKEEPPPEVKKAEVAVPLPVPAPKAIPVPGLAPRKPVPTARDLFKALNSASRQAAPELEGQADGDPDGDAAKAEGERYYGIISAAVRRYYDVSNTIPEDVRRTLKAPVALRVSASGEVIDVRLMKSSGNDLFDNAVLSAVKKAAPFSPPPEQLKKALQTIGVTLAFTP